MASLKSKNELNKVEPKEDFKELERRLDQQYKEQQEIRKLDREKICKYLSKTDKIMIGVMVAIMGVIILFGIVLLGIIKGSP